MKKYFAACNQTAKYFGKILYTEIKIAFEGQNQPWMTISGIQNHLKKDIGVQEKSFAGCKRWAPPQSIFESC